VQEEHFFISNRGLSMGSDESGQVLALLKELSVLKELENETGLGPTANSKRDAHRIQQQEIAGGDSVTRRTEKD
jgi:hypothetical protein